MANLITYIPTWVNDFLAKNNPQLLNRREFWRKFGVG